MSLEKQITLAINARELAYAPYSNFLVGAALKSVDGEFFTGCNIENSGFTATNCAERTAFFKAISQGITDFESIVVVGGPRGEITDFISPCGVCRQVMTEFCDPESFKIILAKSPEQYKTYLLKDLIPLIDRPVFDEDKVTFGF